MRRPSRPELVRAGRSDSAALDVEVFVAVLEVVGGMEVVEASLAEGEVVEASLAEGEVLAVSDGEGFETEDVAVRSPAVSVKAGRFVCCAKAFGRRIKAIRYGFANAERQFAGRIAGLARICAPQI